MLIGTRVGLSVTRGHIIPFLPYLLQFVRVIMNFIWRGPGNIHGFVLDEQFYLPGLTTVHSLTYNTTPLKSYKFTSAVCGNI